MADETGVVPQKRSIFPVYFSEVLIVLNMPLMAVPTPLTAAMIASAMPAAIKPYSIAVAPDSSDRKFNNLRFNLASVRAVEPAQQPQIYREEPKVA